MVAIAALSVVVGAISTARRYSVARRQELDAREKIDADLAAGVAAVERHRATDAVRVILEEHRERAYFMRLEDGRAMFIGYWNPPKDDNPADIQDLPPDLETYPSREFEIVRGPRSRIPLAVSFVGAPLAVSDTLERTPPLDVGQIAPVGWENLRKTYG